MSRVISRATYKRFMKKYNLRLSNKIHGIYKPKSMSQMSKEIYKFETENINQVGNIGLYINGLHHNK